MKLLRGKRWKPVVPGATKVFACEEGAVRVVKPLPCLGRCCGGGRCVGWVSIDLACLGESQGGASFAFGCRRISLGLYRVLDRGLDNVRLMAWIPVSAVSTALDRKSVLVVKRCTRSVHSYVRSRCRRNGSHRPVCNTDQGV